VLSYLVRDDVTGEWRKLHNEELSDLYSSPSIIWMIKSSSMRWAGHVACLGVGGGGFWWGNLKERDHLKDTGVNGRIILRLIFRKWVVGAWTGSMWLRIGKVGRYL
jgi:hypothetical protein